MTDGTTIIPAECFEGEIVCFRDPRCTHPKAARLRRQQDAMIARALIRRLDLGIDVLPPRSYYDVTLRRWIEIDAINHPEITR